jgi:hypothetical protein
MEKVNISALERKLSRAVKAAAEQMRVRDEAIRELAALGVTLDRIGAMAGGLTKGRVSQIVKAQGKGD